MSTYNIEIISDPFELAEGPFWDVSTQSLYFVDILKSKILKYVPSTKKLTSAVVGDRSVSFIIPIKDKTDQFFVSYGNDLAIVTWDGISDKVSNLTVVLNADTREGNRINDGKVGPSGALYFGTMGSELDCGEYELHKGRLFRYKNGEIKTLLENVSLSNGLAWSSDGNTLYYIDSLKYTIDAYNCHPSCSDHIFKKKVYDFKEKNVSGIPDGMTIDTEEKLWVALYGGSEVLRIDPETGEVLTSISLPSLQITSVTFGGEYLNELYVTSANSRLSKRYDEHKYSGCCFRITGLGVSGYPDRPICL